MKKKFLYLSIFFGFTLSAPQILTAKITDQSIIKIVQREEMVMYNTKSHKFHNPSCQWAQRCTKNCISIPLSEAIKRGGIACKVCGG